MKTFDIVELRENNGKSKPCVVFMITPKMIRQGGFNTTRPGLHLLRGYWHGKDPKNYRSYGKTEGFATRGRGPVIGTITTHEAAVRMGL